MTLISIRERGVLHASPVVSIDGQEFPITVSDPFTPQQEAHLEWYFEQHLRFPFTNQVAATAAARSITPYGEALFNQLFADRRAYGRYQAALQAGITTLAFEIAGSPDFHHLHWEALKDPDLPQPFALHTPFVRRNLQPRTIEAQVRDSPTINLLLVTARPAGARDVAYRTIARPLVETLRQAGVPVQIDILRPGTYQALADHLAARRDAHGAGYYHVVHFDVHGALLTFAEFDAVEKARARDHLTYQLPRYGRGKIEPYAGLKAFLFLEAAQGGLADPVEASELTQLLTTYQVPIAILNACQSAKQVASQPEGDTSSPTTRETSLGSQLMQAGLQMVLAMGYSVTVSAAEILMQQLYTQLFQHQDLTTAIRRARLELSQRKARRAYYNQLIDLEDWLLPVVYQNQPQSLQPREFTATERQAYYAGLAARVPEPQVAYRFVGRDLDVLYLERILLTRHNLVLLRGMGGAGKTTLLRHLAWWWQTTGLVDQVFYFGYDERAWTRSQIMDAIARQLLGQARYEIEFQPLPDDETRQAFLAARLRAPAAGGRHHLLLLDNLESITGTHLAIRNTLSSPERTTLQRFLQALSGGAVLVLLGSRSGEEWLAPGTFDDSVYNLGGLDDEAASALADLILRRHHVEHYRADRDFRPLLALLDGYPLALEVVLGNLAQQTPAQVLAALQQGAPEIDPAAGESDPMLARTRSILRCIDYSHGNLAPGDQELLLCLAPFTGIVDLDWLPQYTARLQAQPVLAHLPFERWAQVLQAAEGWGLLAPHDEINNALRPQPIFPYFLRHRLHDRPEMRTAVETAFREHYDDVGGALHQAITAKDKDQRQDGLALVAVEYENLTTALELALRDRVGFFNPYEALFRFLDTQSEHPRALELSEHVLAARATFSPAQMTPDVAQDFYLTFARAAYSALETKQYTTAEKAYREALALIEELPGLPAETRGSYRATVYHQLGRVAQAQRQWAQANQYYHQTLAIYTEFNDRYEQAGTYHQLGIVAQAQRQWAQANQYYQQALAIFIEFNDRYAQASTYHQLGIVARAQRQWAQANQYYQQALAIFSEFNDRYAQASTYAQLGLLAEAAGDPRQAQAYLVPALERFHAAGDPFNVGNVIAILARLEQASPDPTLRPAVAALLGLAPAQVDARFAAAQQEAGD